MGGRGGGLKVNEVRGKGWPNDALGDTGVGDARTPCTSGPAHPVDELLAVAWHVQVHHHVHVWNVEASMGEASVN